MTILKRSHILLYVLLMAALLLAACGQPLLTVPASEAPAGESEAAIGRFEVFSWWTSGGEAAALQVLFDAYREDNPDVNIINATVAGGGGDAARGVLQTRLADGDPPDTWQVHPGLELLGQFVEPGFLEPITDLYQEQGWFDVTPEALVNLITQDGEVYQVIVGVHRGNGLWYNKQLLERNGIAVGDSLSVEEFFQIADQLQTAGVTPLCVGDSGIWASAQLFENTLVAVLGPDKYNGLWNGSTSFDDPQVKEAMEIYGRMLDYQNDDHSDLSWDQAVNKMIEGRCAFNSMGDWAYGEFANAWLEDDVDFGWVSHPGSEGSFVIIADGFGMAKDAPNMPATENWLRTMGSKATQEAFNPLKGSICARTDCDRAKFGLYHNWSMDSFAEDALVPSVVHGSAAPADFQQALNDAVTIFVVDKDVDAFAKALVEAAQLAGFGG
jgi:glucose/mannose transport system substrate-binding protein